MGSRSRLVSDQHVELGTVARASLERHAADALLGVHLPETARRHTSIMRVYGDVTEALRAESLSEDRQRSVTSRYSWDSQDAVDCETSAARIFISRYPRTQRNVKVLAQTWLADNTAWLSVCKVQ